jgi:hypothetical protein
MYRRDLCARLFDPLDEVLIHRLEESLEKSSYLRLDRRSASRHHSHWRLYLYRGGAAIILSLVSVLVAPIGFILILVIARLLDPSRSKKDRQRVQVAAGG